MFLNVYVILGLSSKDIEQMSAISIKELDTLENILEFEVPKLRRMVGPSMGREPFQALE